MLAGSRTAGSGSMAKILIIDDEYLVRYTLARTLRRQGYEVTTAGDGERGMAAFRTGSPDVVIADIVMFERRRRPTIQQMRGECPDAKIIGISGGGPSDDPEILAIARQLGADDVIGKPLDPAELLGRVRRLHKKDKAAA
jgi:DNA-binding response OmpR family regulator